MRIFRAPLFMAAFVVLAGCSSTQDQRAADSSQCSSYGFTPGTDAFSNCLMSANNQRQNQQAINTQAMMNRNAADQAARAAKDKADQDAWDRRTGQGQYAAGAAAAAPAAPKQNCRKVQKTTTLPDGSTQTDTTEDCSSGF